MTIGVIRDSAFQFYYPENLEALEQQGARLVEVSALDDPYLPPELDALYIGGGFPETHAQALAENLSFRQFRQGRGPLRPAHLCRMRRPHVPG